MEIPEHIKYRDERIDNTSKGCGECNFDRWENLVLCLKCLKIKQKEEEKK